MGLRIGGTRITVCTLEMYRRQGVSDEELLEAFQTIVAEDLEAAWDYVANNPDEIEGEIAVELRDV